MESQILRQVIIQSSPYVLPALVLIIISVFTATRTKTPSLKFPFYGDEEGENPEAPKKRWMRDSMNLLREGCAKYPNSIFQIWTTEGNWMVLPPKYIDELKMKSDDIMPSALTDFLQGRHTSFGRPDRPPRAIHAVKYELNKNMAKLFPGVKEEINYSLPREFPQVLKEWTPIVFYPRVCKLVFRVSGRAFAGPTLHHNDDWMMLNINYTRDAFNAALEIRKYPDWLRPYVKYFLPEVRNLWKSDVKAAEFLGPLIRERNRAEKLPGYEKPNDTLEWIRNGLPEWEKKDYEYQANQQLGIGAAAIHTTSQLATNVIFDLAARPQYLPELREEVETVLKNHDGEWTIESMSELRKMDSFIKESQRYSPTVVSFLRHALKPVTLSDGTQIPKDAWLLAPAAAISHDPNVYEEPDKFDGFRYYKMRQDPTEEQKHQFASTSNTQLHFGGGRHACPGRWFASHEIKLIVASLIMKYDMKTIDGVGRPKNILFQSQFSPDPTAKILFKSRD